MRLWRGFCFSIFIGNFSRSVVIRKHGTVSNSVKFWCNRKRFMDIVSRNIIISIKLNYDLSIKFSCQKLNYYLYWWEFRQKNLFSVLFGFFYSSQQRCISTYCKSTFSKAASGSDNLFAERRCTAKGSASSSATIFSRNINSIIKIRLKIVLLKLLIMFVE